MTAFIWFWIIVALVVIGGTVFGIIFSSRVPAPKKKPDKLDEVIFETKDKR